MSPLVPCPLFPPTPPLCPGRELLCPFSHGAPEWGGLPSFYCYLRILKEGRWCQNTSPSGTTADTVYACALLSPSGLLVMHLSLGNLPKPLLTWYFPPGVLGCHLLCEGHEPVHRQVCAPCSQHPFALALFTPSPSSLKLPPRSPAPGVAYLRLPTKAAAAGLRISSEGSPPQA